MNHYGRDLELPELSDEAVRLLFDICRDAQDSGNAPYKALFDAERAVLRQQAHDPDDGADIFPYLLRLGNGAIRQTAHGTETGLLEQLRRLLLAQGITTVLDDEEAEGDVPEPTIDLEPQPTSHAPAKSARRRRVSFDHARVEERWLSEHSEFLTGLEDAQTDLCDSSGRRGHQRVGRRARSTDARHDRDHRNHRPRHARAASQLTDYTSEAEAQDAPNATLVFDLSPTQLEQNAEAFLSISHLRAARHALQIWRQATNDLRYAYDHAYAVATVHDRRTLLKQAWDQLLDELDRRQAERRRAEDFDRQDRRAARERDKMLMGKAFTTWVIEAQSEAQKIRIAQQYVLKIRYFRRWKAIAAETLLKAKRVLCKKFLLVWLQKTSDSRHLFQKAATLYKSTSLRKSGKQLLLAFRARLLQRVKSGQTQREVLSTLSIRLYQQQQLRIEVDLQYNVKLAGQTLRLLKQILDKRERDQAIARQHMNNTIVSTTWLTLKKQASLAPAARHLSSGLDLDLQRKAFGLWHLHASLSLQANAVSDRRVLQNSWTAWNDALRGRALGQRIDDRVALEALYKWVLQGRLALYQRTMDQRLVARVFSYWRTTTGQVFDRLEWTRRVFEESQHRRRLASGMLKLHAAMRQREDAERIALEFANGRQIPKLLWVWREKSCDATRLAKWSADARFYFLGSSTLRRWKDKTVEHRQSRKREAYAQIRTRVKARLVRDCFRRLHARHWSVVSMVDEAARIEHTRIEKIAVDAFSTWYRRAARLIDMAATAIDVDRKKLLYSAFSAMILREADLSGMEQQAFEFRNETDLSILATIFKKVQWAQFTAVRRLESADALWARNRDTHVRNMLRHWAGRANERSTQARSYLEPSQHEPESPSIRPASRAAARSIERTPREASLATTGATTPGYMRTPSRSHRRAGRFRPLSAPRPLTPMVFDSAYLATTPAPAASAGLFLRRGLHDDGANALGELGALTPQVTPFARKLRAGGFTPVGPTPSALRSSTFGRPGLSTGKSVRFAGASRFGSSVSSERQSELVKAPGEA